MFVLSSYSIWQVYNLKYNFYVREANMSCSSHIDDLVYDWVGFDPQNFDSLMEMFSAKDDLMSI